MLVQANTTVSILRGTATNAYGDEVSNDTVAASGVRCALYEQRNSPSRPADDRPQTVRYATGRVPYGTDVLSSDRLRDERTGRVYVIDTVSDFASVIVNTGVLLDLRRVSGETL